MAKKIITLEEQIAELKSRREAELAKEIEQLKLLAEIDDARFELQQKLQSEWNIFQNKKDVEERELRKTFVQYKKDFEKQYGQPFETELATAKQPSLTLNEKLKLVSEMTNDDGTPKYRLNSEKTAIIGAKGEPIRSTIVFKDSNGNKQTVGASTFFKYLNPDVEKEEIEKIFLKKDIVIDKLRDGTLTEEEKEYLKL